MSKFLSELLDAKEPLFTLALQQLEKASGNKAVDNKLKAEIIEKAHNAMRELGLDHDDTTGPELYQALLSKAKEHDEHLAKSIGVKDSEDVEEVVPLVVSKVAEVDMPRDCWVI